ncbi:hypothetical protein SAMN05421736_11164 [Evansella caseinilytica]|uniref:Uncharacterized protein n=1 Tax=Evansella caseinilytica TaxID=1503961 RepID=A0A1H3SJH1_9BACI|nr:hypothetical protein [Evansella caseinilytica]SDZ38136.1 hypothetical protein SAMN05421736_11164 [Evansella caseinilytica]
MRTIIFVLLGWIGGHLLGSGFIKLLLFIFDIDVTNVPFVILLLPYLSALGLAFALPIIDKAKQ